MKLELKKSAKWSSLGCWDAPKSPSIGKVFFHNNLEVGVKIKNRYLSEAMKACVDYKRFLLLYLPATQIINMHKLYFSFFIRCKCIVFFTISYYISNLQWRLSKLLVINLVKIMLSWIIPCAEYRMSHNALKLSNALWHN